jgi:hypothetical protein
MPKEAQFGYGFLLVGLGAPFLIDKLFGPSLALGIATICTVAGVGLLVAGHLHREKDEKGAKREISRPSFIVASVIIIACVSTLGWSVWKFASAKITGRIEMSLRGGYQVSPDTPEWFSVVVRCLVANNTDSAIGLNNWRVGVRFKDGRTVWGHAYFENGDFNAPMRGFSINTIPFKAEDYLPTKTRTPIQPRSEIPGWYRAAFVDGVTKAQAQGVGATLIVAFDEIGSGRMHAIEEPMDARKGNIPGIH